MPHYFDSQPTSAENPGTASVRIAGNDFIFDTAGGVFSSRRVDYGTLLLIESAISDLRAAGFLGERMLDLGCGYGPVGIALKRVFPYMEAVFTDINARALQLAESNAKKNRISGATFIQSDGYHSIQGMFDLILTNPPIRAGKAVVQSFFAGAYERLNPAGMLYTVIQKKQGAPSASAYLEKKFGNCLVIEKSAGYRVLKCIR